jgi:hypothetical protein
MEEILKYKDFIKESKTQYYDYPTSIDKDKNLISPRFYKNIFKIIIKNIGTYKSSTKTLFLENQEEVIKVIDFCRWVETHYDYNQINKVGKEIFGNRFKDIVDIDKTSFTKGTPCIPKLESVTYFDENGDEHRVNIKK